MEQFFEYCGLLLGLLYLYWEFRAHRLMWVASLLMTCCSLFVYWNHGLYADFGINVYYLLAACYGFVWWSLGGRKQKGDPGALPISRTPLRWWLPLFAIFALVYDVIVTVLLRWTDSNVPYVDALNTSLSIVAMGMQARKWVEQWLVWLAVDAVSVGLYVYKGIETYAVLYAIYTILAWVGYRHWLKKMSSEGKQ